MSSHVKRGQNSLLEAFGVYRPGIWTASRFTQIDFLPCTVGGSIFSGRLEVLQERPPQFLCPASLSPFIGTLGEEVNHALQGGVVSIHEEDFFPDIRDLCFFDGANCLWYVETHCR